MKNIKEVIRGNDSVSLEFTDKNSKGTINYTNGAFDISPKLQDSVTGVTDEEIQKTVRKTLTPYFYESYLPIGSPYTTPVITAGAYTKLLIPTTVKGSNEWGVADVGGGNFAVQYTGASNEKFKIFTSTSMTTSANNVVIDIVMYKNGVLEPGIAISRKVGTGADVGALAIQGEFEATTNDYIEIYVQTDVDSTITFDKTAISVIEVN